MKKLIINNNEYEIVKDYKEALDIEEVKLKCSETDYFDLFDYIFGDYAYNKLRLKGFYEADNKNVSEINSISSLENYIENYCAYNCGHFLLKKIK